MGYKCPLQDPHVGSDGNPMVHKTRSECLKMAGGNRQSAAPHPEPSGTEVAPLNKEAGKDPAGLKNPQASPTPKKKGAFSFFKKDAKAAPEGSPEQKEQTQEPEWKGPLSGDLTLMFWNSVTSMLAGFVGLVDNAIHAEHPYDTKKLSLTTSEQMMVKEALPGLTTRILKWFGIKSEKGAEFFIHSLVIVRVFGRIFVGVGIHYYEEAKIRGKKRKAKEDEEIQKGLRQPRGLPPAPPKPKEETPETPPSRQIPPQGPRRTPAEMELMQKVLESEIPKGAQ
jgi:hypothetical protein